MSDLRKAAEIALDALEEINKLSIGKNAISLPAEIDNAMDALRAALAEPEQEPVAWAYVNSDGECEQIEYDTPPDHPSVTPLYAVPPQRKPLTDEAVQQLYAACCPALYQFKGFHGGNFLWLVRIIEQAHGIGSKDE